MEEDIELYEEFLKGNEEAFNTMIQKYKANLIYFITRYVKNIDIAEDIFQTTILYILENKEKYNKQYSFKTYLYMIAKSRALNYLKQDKRTEDIEDHQVELPEENLLEDVILTNERQEKIRNVIRKLKKDYQIAIYLTQIEGLSYRETAHIMEKNEKQIKNLVFHGKQSLKKLLIQEKVVEIKNNKVIKLFLWFVLLTVVISGVVYAGYKIYEKYKATILSTWTQKIGDNDTNHVWIGSFQLAWNQFMEEREHGVVEFEEGNPELVEELNKKSFTKEQLSKKDYWIEIAPTAPELKEKIRNQVKNKFDLDNSTTLDKMNFNLVPSYTIYCILVKNFHFIYPFDKLASETFNHSEEKVKYFGIENSSNENVKENVKVLFYHSQEDFAVKLMAKEQEEIILYRTNEENTLEKYYQELEKQAETYTGNREFLDNDQLKIPYMNIDTEINYGDLCGKVIKGTNGMYLANAFQNIKFSFNEEGGNLISETMIEDLAQSVEEETKQVSRHFYYTNHFVLFLKEADKEQPYFALKVDTTDIMELE